MKKDETFYKRTIFEGLFACPLLYSHHAKIQSVNEVDTTTVNRVGSVRMFQ